MDTNYSDYTLEQVIADPDAGLKVLQEAAVATALAFYDKNPYVQYEAGFNSEDKSEEVDKADSVVKLAIRGGRPLGFRRRYKQTPEFAQADTEYIAQCSSFAAGVYYNAFGFEIRGGDTYWKPCYDKVDDRTIYLGNLEGPDQVVMVFDPKGDGRYGEREYHELGPALEAFQNLLEPGDLIGTPGHLLMYLGQCMGPLDPTHYCIHCWPREGGLLNAQTGKQTFETYGAAVLQPMYELLLREKKTKSWPQWRLGFTKTAEEFSIMRPMMSAYYKDYHMTKAAEGRLRYPRMATYYNLADRNIYGHVLPGEEVDVEFKVCNRGDSDYENLKVELPLPAHTALMHTDGTYCGGAIRWSLQVPARTEKILHYTIRIDGKVGEEITFPAGTVDTIPTRTFKQKIGAAKLTAEQERRLRALEAFDAKEKFEDLAFINRFYKEVLGMDVKLPDTVQEYIGSRFNVVDMENTWKKEFYPTMVPKTCEKHLADMEVPMHLSGRCVCLDEDVQKSVAKRALEIREYFYTPGDVFITFGPSASQYYPTEENIELDVYLGNGKALKYTHEGAAVVSFEDSIALHLKQSLCVTLRPCMAE